MWNRIQNWIKTLRTKSMLTRIFGQWSEDQVQPFLMTYSPEVDAVYIYNRGRKSEYGVVEKTEGIHQTSTYLDYDKDGKVYGIEVLDPDKVTLAKIFELFGERKNQNE